MSSKRLRPDDVRELRRMLADGIVYREIAEAFDVSVGCVTYHAKRAGLERKGPGTQNGKPVEDLLDIDDQPWADDALCAQTDPEAFFPEKGGSTREAKKVCNGNPERGIPACPVKAECLAYALDNDIRFGIWGGVSERERRTLKKQAS